MFQPGLKLDFKILMRKKVLEKILKNAKDDWIAQQLSSSPTPCF
jgi:hypothetical protein